MGNLSLAFESPWFLLFLCSIPLMWVSSFKALAALGNGRRLAALTFRSLVLLLLCCGLAGLQWVWISDKVTVIYLLDQSDSIARGKRELMLDYATKSVRSHRDRSRGDRAGLIVFGREAAIEFPPYDDDLPTVRGVESYLGRTDATNLEAALKLAQASFPEDAAKRIVIISDGIETIGQAGYAAKAMIASGVGIDVVPIDLMASSEILVEKVDLPANIRQGQPFQTRVVISRYQSGDERPVNGRLRLIRSVGGSDAVIVDDNVVLEKDVNVFPITDTIDQPAGYNYRAEFIPDRPEDDALQQNNRADAFTYVRGKGRVLLIEDWRNPGENGQLVEALLNNEIEVQRMQSNQLYTSLAQLQAYDSVILAGVPRSSGTDAQDVSNFSDDQIDMLVANTEQFGSGLVMIGGPDALGAGGWSNSAIEKAMPVDFQVKNTKIEAVGALAMVMHASEIAQGNYWQKRIAEESIRILGPMDYCGVLQFSSLGDVWLWGDRNGMLRVGPNRSAMLQRIRNMSPQDMPDFQPSMQMVLSSLQAVPASIKHAIIISDGDPAPPPSGLVNQFANSQIKVSTVAVGAHGPAGHQTLQDIANKTGGNYYVASNAAALPRIFQREAMRVTRPLVREPDGGLQPEIIYPHEVLTGLQRQLPKAAGYVLSSVKDSPLVEVSIRANDAEVEPENQTLLATWSYGLGRSAVFTSDSGRRWTSQWVDWEEYARFWAQLIRWTMRPTESDAKFSIATSNADGNVQVVVNALDKNDEFLNFLEMQAVAVGPDLNPLPIVMRQVAPGRYVGSFDADAAGSYLVNVVPAPGSPSLTTGASVPYSDEYRIRRTNYALLEQISGLTPNNGQPGILTTSLDANSFQELLSTDFYRAGLPRAMSLQDIWHWCLLVCSICLLGDVFVRRVALDYSYPFKWLAGKLFGVRLSEKDLQRQASLQRLRGRKSELADNVQSNNSSLRFEGNQGDQVIRPQDSITDALQSKASSKSPTKDTGMSEGQVQEKSYTDRLLAAKRAARKKAEDDGGQ